MPASLVHLIVCGICVAVFGGAHLLGWDLHRDGADYSDLSHCLTVVLHQDLAHSFSAGQGTIYSAGHLVFKTDRASLVFGKDDIDVVRPDRLDTRSRSDLNMNRSRPASAWPVKSL